MEYYAALKVAKHWYLSTEITVIFDITEVVQKLQRQI